MIEYGIVESINSILITLINANPKVKGKFNNLKKRGTLSNSSFLFKTFSKAVIKTYDNSQLSQRFVGSCCIANLAIYLTIILP